MLALLEPQIRATPVQDGVVLSSSHPLPEPKPTLCDWLDHWAAATPDAPFLAERQGEGWRTVSWREAQARVSAIAVELAERGAGPDAPVLVLSENSVDHALVGFGAMHIGAPVAPASPAYSLQSATFGRLLYIAKLVDPAVVYVEERGPFAGALGALGLPDDAVLDASAVRAAASWRARGDDIGPDTVCKILFTSGSTGEPKGVVNTHRMLTANQESLRACWPFLEAERPVVVDWLPWSHTFGGNHNLHLVLRNGGTLYIDKGRPAPTLIETTLRNMADVGPNLWFNVPRGFDQAVEVLERDLELARAAFRNLRVVFYAAAALAPTTRSRLEAVARQIGREDLFFTSAWGSTETAPLSTSAHFPTPTTGNLGVPVPGVELKLARVDDRLELRVRGPNVTPGYWQRGGGILPVPRDADGFLPTGDAGRLVDEARPEAGVVFAGRISENFKLSSGTWVNVGPLRLGLVDACAPYLQDVVIAGQDHRELGALLIAPQPRDELRAALAAWNAAHPGSSERIARALVLDRPLSLDDGETTDKGYTNQRRVLERRAAEVERLFAESPDPAVWVL